MNAKERRRSWHRQGTYELDMIRVVSPPHPPPPQSGTRDRYEFWINREQLDGARIVVGNRGRAGSRGYAKMRSKSTGNGGPKASCSGRFRAKYAASYRTGRIPMNGNGRLSVRADHRLGMQATILSSISTTWFCRSRILRKHLRSLENILENGSGYAHRVPSP